MPVPPAKFWQSLGISTFLPPPQEKNRSPAPESDPFKRHRSVPSYVTGVTFSYENALGVPFRPTSSLCRPTGKSNVDRPM